MKTTTVIIALATVLLAGIANHGCNLAATAPVPSDEANREAATDASEMSAEDRGAMAVPKNIPIPGEMPANDRGAAGLAAIVPSNKVNREAAGTVSDRGCYHCAHEE